MGTFIFRDFLVPARAEMAYMTRFKSVFDKAWPKTPDGKNYQPQLDYYSGRVQEYQAISRFYNMLNVDVADLKSQDYNEIERAYFKLDKPEEFVNDLSKAQIANDMDFHIGNGVQVVIEYGGNFRSYSSTMVGEVEVTITSRGKVVGNWNELSNSLADQIIADPVHYLFEIGQSTLTSNVYGTKSNTKARAGGASVPTTALISNHKYGLAPLVDKDNFKLASKTIIPTSPAYTQDNNHIGLGFSVVLDYDVIDIPTSSSDCVRTYFDIYNTSVKGNGNSTLDMREPTKTLKALYLDIYGYTSNTLFDDIGPGPGLKPGSYTPIWALNVDKANSMKKRDFFQLVTENLSSDVEVEEANDWEKFASVVIIVIAVVAAVFTYGYSLILSGSVIGAVGAALGIATLALSLGTLALSAAGGPSTAGLVKFIGGVANVLGWVATALGVYSIVSSFYKKALEQAIQEATKEAAKEGVSEAIEVSTLDVLYEMMDILYEAIVDSVVASIDKLTAGTINSITEVAKWLDQGFKIYEYYSQNYGEAKELRDALKASEEEVAKLMEENEENSNHMLDAQFELFSGSYGSFDAIEMLEQKNQLLHPANRTADDPLTKLI